MKTQRREFAISYTREADNDQPTREITGRAVPYNEETEIWPGFNEIIARDAVTEPENDTVKLFSRHRDPIGVVTKSEHREDGYYITARISNTPAGDEALTLMRDGVINRLSIGFDPIEWEDAETKHATVRTQKKILVREVSVVPFPAYEKAEITSVRHKEEPMTDTTTQAVPDLDQIRQELDEVRRDLAFATAPTPDTAVETRNAGAILQALVAGDEPTRRHYEALVQRAWDGTKIADDATTNYPAWVKNLVRTYDAQNFIGRHFASAPLAANGMSVDFIRLNANSLQVAEQMHEGDDLAFGKMSTTRASESVHTFGGYTSVSINEIERGSSALISAQLTAMAQAAGIMSAKFFEAKFAEACKQRVASSSAMTLPKAVASWKWADVCAFLIDAAKEFSDHHLPLTGLVVDVPTFKALAALTDSQDNPRMPLSGTSTPGTQIGAIDLSQITGRLGSLIVQPHWNMKTGDLGTGAIGALFTSSALVRYETALTQLQDSNIVNLTRQWSVYRFGMVAWEQVDGLVPVKAAS